MTKDQEIQVEVAAFVKRVEGMGVRTHVIHLGTDDENVYTTNSLSQPVSLHNSIGGNILELMLSLIFIMEDVAISVKDKEILKRQLRAEMNGIFTKEITDSYIKLFTNLTK